MKSRKRRPLAVSFFGLLAGLVALVPHAASAGEPAPDAAAPGAPAAPAAVQTRRYLLVPFKFDDTLAVPLKSKEQYLNYFEDPRFGAELFYQVSSNNYLSLAGSEVAEPAVLPQAAAAYQDAGAWSPQLLLDDLEPILEQTYDLGTYYGIVLLPNVADKAGRSSVGRPVPKKAGEGGKKPLPAICLNPSNLSLVTLVREIGHSFGLTDTRASDPALASGADAMSFTGPADARLGNVTCDHLMWHKLLLGWPAPGECAVFRGPGSHAFRLYPRSGPAGGLRLVQVPLGTDGEFLTVEAVLPAGIDGLAGLPGYGALACRVKTPGARPEDPSAVPAADRPEVQVAPNGSLFFARGETWATPDGGVSFKIERLNDQYCDVRIEVK